MYVLVYACASVCGGCRTISNIIPKESPSTIDHAYSTTCLHFVGQSPLSPHSGVTAPELEEPAEL